MFNEGPGETKLTVYLGASIKVFNVADCSSEFIKLVLVRTFHVWSALVEFEWVAE